MLIQQRECFRLLGNDNRLRKNTKVIELYSAINVFNLIANNLQRLEFVIYNPFLRLIFALILVLIMLLCLNKLHMNHSLLQLMLNMCIFIVNITDLTENYVGIFNQIEVLVPCRLIHLWLR